MSTKSYTEEIKDNVKSTYKNILAWLEQHDSEAWPSFWIFLAVVTIGMVFNIDAFTPVVGQFAAIGIGLFFEAAIIAWKSTTSRKRNDSKQSQIAYWALWLSVLLAISMLIVNLFRIGGEQGFENLAYIIVGTAAGVQVVFYLIFDGANPDKTMTREHSQNEREILRKQRKAGFTISEVESDALIIEMIGTKLDEIRRKFSHLPTELLEPLLETARKNLLKEYSSDNKTVEAATRPMADLNGDGRIGTANKTPTPEKFQVGEKNLIAHGKNISEMTTWNPPIGEVKEIVVVDDPPTETPTDATDANELPSNVEESHPEDF